MIGMYITISAVGFVLLLVCIESFLRQRERQKSEEAERAIYSLQRCRKDVLAKVGIYSFLPEENLWRSSLQLAIMMSENTLHSVHDLLGQSIKGKKCQIYESVTAACQQSERALRDTFSSVEAFLVDTGSSARYQISESGRLMECSN